MNRVSLRRLFDFLAIVAVAVVLLGLAWQVGQVTSQTPISRGDHPSAVVDRLDDSQNLQLRLPLERFGMEMSREAFPGDPKLALAHLDGQCREVLAEADSWVLSLEIPEQERAVLDQIQATPPLEARIGTGEVRYSIFPMTDPMGRACVREYAARSGDAASPGRRLLCWGFILGEGTDAQTVWFARPREKLPVAAAHSFPPPSLNREEGHAP